jgi:hypothetical protein
MKKSYALSLLVLSLLSSPLARGEESSSWDAAFPREAGETTDQVIHGIGAANEILYGSFFFPVAGKAARDVALEDVEEKLLKDRSYKLAVDRMVAAHPEYKEVIKNYNRYLDLGLKASKNTITAAERAELAEVTAFVDKNEALRIRAHLDIQAEAKITAKMPADELRKLRSWASEEASAVKEAKKIKAKYLGQVALGALLVADGGARLGAMLTHRDPGFFPAISAARGLVKPAAPKNSEERRDGAQTSMSAE